MNQLKHHIDPIKPPIKTDKNLVYKGKKYPIDFSLFKKYSNYFYINRKNYKFQDDIELKAINHVITDESIPVFIACCQNEPFDITDDNIFSLYQLSIQYEVPTLINLTKQYIEENPKPIIFESILFKLQNKDLKVNIDLSNLENIVASNFFNYINDERLLSLPINILYRIINKEQLNINSMNNLTYKDQFIEFLFKCLDKYQREASILFQNLDLENEQFGVLNRLLTHYSDVFDFNFINSKYLAKNTSFLLSELQKQKIEQANKIAEMESENKKQRDFFASAQSEFNESKSDLLNSNHLLEEKVTNLEKKLMQMEQELKQQATIIEKFTKNKVVIKCDSNQLRLGSTITLKASVKSEFAFTNNGVEWKIIQETEGSINIESQNEKYLTLKCLRPFKTVTVVANANDFELSTEKEIEFECLQGIIEINVQQNQIIKGRITIKEKNSLTLDKSKSRYLLNTNNSQNLGENAYTNGYILDNFDKEVSFAKPRGDYYLHVLIVENTGYAQEIVSNVLHTNGVIFRYGPTESIQSIELNVGNYKLEAWGAQGGSYDSTYHGGYGGYSTGTINLSSKTTLFVVVGKSTNSEAGGYNGGGCGGPSNKPGSSIYTFGGGGASHIGFKSGELKSFHSDYASNLLIVASGGGGTIGSSNEGYKQYFAIGGCGGGFTGANGNSTTFSDRVGTGASQTSGGKNNYSNWDECGSFGQGSNCKDHSIEIHFGGGGGGGFYGGGSGGNTSPGGGGSGFINTKKLTNAFMYGYEVPTSSSVESKTFSTTNVSSDPVSNYAKQNDGYVIITPL